MMNDRKGSMADGRDGGPYLIQDNRSPVPGCRLPGCPVAGCQFPV